MFAGLRHRRAAYDTLDAGIRPHRVDDAESYPKSFAIFAVFCAISSSLFNRQTRHTSRKRIFHRRSQRFGSQEGVPLHSSSAAKSPNYIHLYYDMRPWGQVECRRGRSYPRTSAPAQASSRAAASRKLNRLRRNRRSAESQFYLGFAPSDFGQVPLRVSPTRRYAHTPTLRPIWLRLRRPVPLW